MKKIPLAVLIGLVFVVLVYGLAYAKVTGDCYRCHTMHASQTPWPADWGDEAWLRANPQRALVVNSCFGCHTGTNPDPNIPYVFSTVAPTYDDSGLNAGTSGGNCLAGGNFYWADTDDAKGHNVVGLSTVSTFSEPPGYSQAATYGRPASWDMTKFTCGGTYGCHGDPGEEDEFAAISGAHHGDDSCLKLATYDDAEAGTDVPKSYRFLLGIKGIEDDDREYQPLSTEHNVYKGEDRTTDAISSTATISYLCAQCHGDFHSGTGNLGMASNGIGSPWIRHPTDYDMGNVSTKEYGGYGHPGQAVGTYSVIAPVAWVNLAASMALTPVTFADDTVVTCISCHRAHGTPVDDLLRWNYVGMDAGSDPDPRNNIGGCFICHTTK